STEALDGARRDRVDWQPQARDELRRVTVHLNPSDLRVAGHGDRGVDEDVRAQLVEDLLGSSSPVELTAALDPSGACAVLGRGEGGRDEHRLDGRTAPVVVTHVGDA